MLDQEILTDFRAESNQLLDELDELLENLEEHQGADFPAAMLKEFSQKIDRIMGAAKTMLSLEADPGLEFLARVSEMCKTMGYQAAALQKTSLLPIFVGFWAETVEVMREVLGALDSPEKSKAVVESRSATLQKRLTWLAEKVAPGSEEEKAKVMAMLKKL